MCNYVTVCFTKFLVPSVSIPRVCSLSLFPVCLSVIKEVLHMHPPRFVTAMAICLKIDR